MPTSASWVRPTTLTPSLRRRSAWRTSSHFREEYQTPDGEAARNDKDYMYVGCWKYTGDDEKPVLLKEPLNYESIKVQTRNYKS